MDVLDKFSIRASVLLNAEVCEKHPAIIEEGTKRKWEWLGHGMTNSISMLDYAPEEERAIIHNVKEIIAKATGKAPKGWLGPGLGETPLPRAGHRGQRLVQRSPGAVESQGTGQ